MLFYFPHLYPTLSLLHLYPTLSLLHLYSPFLSSPQHREHLPEASLHSGRLLHSHQFRGPAPHDGTLGGHRSAAGRTPAASGRLSRLAPARGRQFRLRAQDEPHIQVYWRDGARVRQNLGTSLNVSTLEQLDILPRWSAFSPESRCGS